MSDKLFNTISGLIDLSVGISGKIEDAVHSILNGDKTDSSGIDAWSGDSDTDGSLKSLIDAVDDIKSSIGVGSGDSDFVTWQSLSSALDDLSDKVDDLSGDVNGKASSDDLDEKLTVIGDGLTGQIPMINSDGDAEWTTLQLQMAGVSQSGMVKLFSTTSGGAFLVKDLSGSTQCLFLNPATNALIDARSNVSAPVTTDNVEYAVRSVAAKITTIPAGTTAYSLTALSLLRLTTTASHTSMHRHLNQHIHFQ